MAEALLNSLAKKEKLNIIAESAGICAINGCPANENSMKCLKKNDVDIAMHKSRNITKSMVKKFDLIITMTSQHKTELCKVFWPFSSKIYTLAEYAGEDNDIEDPYFCGEEAYIKSFATLKKYIEKLLINLKIKT